MAKKNGQRVGYILAILTDYLARIANGVDEGGWPTTSEHSKAPSLGPLERPLIGGIKSDIPNYLTKIIDARSVEREFLAPGRVKDVAKGRSDSTQALHTLLRRPNEGLSEITTFLARERWILGDH